jgi:hypothetical protein
MELVKEYLRIRMMIECQPTAHTRYFELLDQRFEEMKENPLDGTKNCIHKPPSKKKQWFSSYWDCLLLILDKINFSLLIITLIYLFVLGIKDWFE